jgi:oxygen-independent coproporphyrinogen III oxidase
VTADDLVLIASLFDRHTALAAPTFQYPPTVKDEATVAAFEQELGFVLSQPWSGPLVTFVSVPYCTKRCFGCPYFKSLVPRHDGLSMISSYVRSLVTQIQWLGSHQRYAETAVDAVYVGGGTGSLLSADQLSYVVSALGAAIGLAPGVEITLEGNPKEFAQARYVRAVREAGVTRVSVGYQSPEGEILHNINSPHKSDEGALALRNAMAAGFTTVNVDLMYRLPGQVERMFWRGINEVVQTGAQGITLYEYVLYPGTPAERLHAADRLAPRVSADTAHRWYMEARRHLQEAGYIELRKGSFALPGHVQRYGALAYGGGAELLGVGAGAYGYLGGYQYKLPDRPEEFIGSIDSRRYLAPHRASARATPRMERERFVILNLLTGHVSDILFHQIFGSSIAEEFAVQVAELEVAGLLSLDRSGITLTAAGSRRRADVQKHFFGREFVQ